MIYVSYAVSKIAITSVIHIHKCIGNTTYRPESKLFENILIVITTKYGNILGEKLVKNFSCRYNVALRILFLRNIHKTDNHSNAYNKKNVTSQNYFILVHEVSCLKF